MKNLALIALCLLFLTRTFGQEVHEVIYQLDCPSDWQDSLMQLQTDPAMVLYCSSSHSMVIANAPFAQSIDSRIMDLPSWTQKTAKGYWVQYQGEEADSSLISFSFNAIGKAKKSETLLGYATKKTDARTPAFTREKIEITYTEDLRGVHPWCPNLKGIPLRIMIPTEMGNYILEAKDINPRAKADIPNVPQASVKAEVGQEVKEHYLFDPDSTSLIVFGVVKDEFSGSRLGLIEIKVFDKERLISSTRTDIRGVYDLRLKAGGVYTIEIGTAPFVIKRIQIELLTMRPRGDNPLLQLDGSIFQNPKHIDCSLLNAPILKLYYDMNAKDIGFDENYNTPRADQLRLLLEQIK